MAGPFEEEVWRLVAEIPCGRVMTYGQVAEAAGSPKAFQAVGNAMRRAQEENRPVPWQRVVRAEGFLSDDAPRSQEALLRGEGVGFLYQGRVDLRKHQWSG